MKKKTSQKKNLPDDVPTNFFIHYANLSLSKNPENLEVIFEKISQFESKYLREIEAIGEQPSSHNEQVEWGIFDWDVQSARIRPREINIIISEIIYLMQNDERHALELNRCISSGGGSSSFVNKYRHRLSIAPAWHNIAFKAVYAYCYYGCKDCEFNFEQQRKFQFINTYGKDLLSGKNRINCIECEQLAFQLMLNGITENRSYDDFFGFGEYLAARNERVRACATRGIRKSYEFNFFQNETTIAQKEIFDPVLTYYREMNFASYTENYKYIFPNYLRSLMGFSLINYLMHKKRGGYL